MKLPVQQSICAMLAGGIALEALSGHAHEHVEALLPIDGAFSSPVARLSVATTLVWPVSPVLIGAPRRSV